MTENRKHIILKMYTPRTPRPSIMVVWFLLFSLSPILGISQGLQDVTDYENSFVVHTGLKYDLANYRSKEVKKKWWYWLPNIGFTFGLPHISFNSNQLAVFDKQNEERKLLQLEIHQDYKIQVNEGLQVLRNKYRLIQLKQTELTEQIGLFTIKESLYKIEMSAFANGGTIPLEKIKSELLMEEQKIILNMLEREITRMIYDLELFSFYKLEIKPFREGLDGCILESKEFQK